MTGAFRHLLDAVENVVVVGSLDSSVVSVHAATALQLWFGNTWWFITLPIAIPMLLVYGFVQLDARCRKRAAEARIREAEAKMREADASLAASRALLVHALVNRFLDADGSVPSELVITAVISQQSPDISVLDDPALLGTIGIGPAKP